MKFILYTSFLIISSFVTIISGGSTFFQSSLIGPTANTSSTNVSTAAFVPFLSINNVDIHFNTLHKSFALGLDGLVDTGNPGYTNISNVPVSTIITGGEAKYGPTAYIQASMLWSHNIYWQSLASPGQGGSPNSNLTTLINQSFGSQDNLLSLFLNPIATNYFGSGWVWLARGLNSNQLQVVQTHDTIALDTSLYVPLLCIDVFEHAFYLDYNASKALYVSNTLTQLINWNFANNQLALANVATDVGVLQNNTVPPPSTTKTTFDNQVMRPTFMYGDLAPYLSYNTVHIHYSKLHKAYATKLDSLVATGNPGYASILGVSLSSIIANPLLYGPDAVKFAGQLVNHNLYWASLAPPGTGGAPSTQLTTLLTSSNLTLATALDAELKAAQGILGSGWVWLLYSPDANSVSVQTTPDGGTYAYSSSSYVPLFVLDVWEHAYYLDYNASANTYFTNTLSNLVNWNYSNAVLVNATSIPSTTGIPPSTSTSGGASNSTGASGG